MASLKETTIKRRLFYNYVPVSHLLYRLCKRYTDFYNGENISDIATNGELHFMQRILPQCSFVFDVGANVGDWTSLALDINPQLTVHCFEPIQTTYQSLLTRGFPSSVIRNDFGMSSKTRRKTLYVFEEGAGINSLYRRHGLEGGFGLRPQSIEETVRLRTLDSYCQELGIEVVDYLKIDVEGHELEVLKGGKRVLEQEEVRIIQFEYVGANIDARVLLKDIFEFLQGFGYAFYKIFPKELRRVDSYDQRLENFQYQNWIAAKGDDLS